MFATIKKSGIDCWKFIYAVYKHFQEEKCTTRAAALSYTTLLSIVPLTTVSLVVLKAFPDYQSLTTNLQHFIFDNFIASSAQVVETHLSHFVDQATKLSATSIIFLIFTAVLMIFNIELAMNAIWHVEKRRHGIPAFLIYWAVLTLLPLLIALAFTISNKITDYLNPFHLASYAWLKSIYYLSPFIITWISFSLLYIAMPNRKVPFKSALAGAFIAAVLFEAAKRGFTLYITHFPTYALLYGALAAVPIFLVWIYLSWLIILCGAVIAYIFHQKKQTS